MKEDKKRGGGETVERGALDTLTWASRHVTLCHQPPGRLPTFSRPHPPVTQHSCNTHTHTHTHRHTQTHTHTYITHTHTELTSLTSHHTHDNKFVSLTEKHVSKARCTTPARFVCKHGRGSGKESVWDPEESD